VVRRGHRRPADEIFGRRAPGPRRTRSAATQLSRSSGVDFSQTIAEAFSIVSVGPKDDLRIMCSRDRK
jgi:hypothetical protein